MTFKLTTSIAFAALMLCSSAHASVVTSYFCFGPGGCTYNSTLQAWTPVTNGTPTQVSNGVNFNGTSGGSVTVSADQANSSGTFITPAKYNGTATESGMFEVSDKYNNRGVGIAPYNPIEGTSSGTYSTQDGLTDTVYDASTNNNFLLLDLSNIAYGSTVSLLLQAGVSGDQFDVYAGGTSTPTSFSGMTKLDTSPVNVDEGGTSMPNGTSTGQGYQFTFTKTTASTSNEWIAISADCHYLLLTEMKITTNTSTVPEPRFYGLLMAGMLGLAGIYARKRRGAEVNA